MADKTPAGTYECNVCGARFVSHIPVVWASCVHRNTNFASKQPARMVWIGRVLKDSEPLHDTEFKGGKVVGHA